MFINSFFIGIFLKFTLCTEINFYEGDEFILMFPFHCLYTVTAATNYPCQNPAKQNLYISPTAGDVIVEVYIKQNNFNQTYQSKNEWNQIIEINLTPQNVMYVINNSSTKSKAIYIKSDGKVIVLAISSASAGARTSNGAFTVLPLHAISGNRKYVIVTSCIQYECFIGITTGAASAHVSIILKSNYTMTIENQHPKTGQRFDSDLEEFETIHMCLNSIDLTGTIVESNDTIAVFSGGVYNYLSTTIGPNKGNNMIEQMVPDNMFGHKYVMAAPTNTTADAFFSPLIIVAGISTEDYKLKVSPNLIEWENNTYNITGDKPATIESDVSVLVTLIFVNRFGFSGSYNCKPAMVVLQPLEAWGTRYAAIFTSHVYNAKVLLQIITAISCKSTFNFTSNQIRHYSNESDEAYTTYVYQILDNKTLMIENVDCPFTGYVVSYVINSSSPAFAYPLSPISPTVKPTESSSKVTSVPTTYPSSDAMTGVTSSTAITAFASSSITASSTVSYVSNSLTTLTHDTAGIGITSTNVFTDITASVATLTSHANNIILATTNAFKDFTNCDTAMISLAASSSITSTNILTDISNSIMGSTTNSNNISITPSNVAPVDTNTVTTLTTQTSSIEWSIYIGTKDIALATFDVTSTVSDVTISATSTIQTTYNSQTVTPVIVIDSELATTNKGLKCPCNCLNKLVELTKQNFTLSKALQIEIVRKLLIKKSSLSSYRREKISTENVEKSEQYIGSTFGVLTVCIVISVIVLCDLVIFTKFLCPYLNLISNDRIELQT